MSPFTVIVIIVAFMAFYCGPSIIAYYRRAEDLQQIVLLNLFAAYTGVGWVMAFVWALTGRRATEHPRSVTYFQGVAWHDDAPSVPTKAELARMNYEAMFPPEEREYPTHPGRREPHF